MLPSHLIPNRVSPFSTLLHPEPKTAAREPTLRRDRHTNTQILTEPQRNKQSRGRRPVTPRREHTDSVFSTRGRVCVQYSPNSHIFLFSQEGTVGTTLSLPVSVGLNQSPSDKEQHLANHRHANGDKCLDLKFPCFPPKIVVWRQGSFCFGIIRVSFILSSVPLDLRPPGSQRRISHSSVPHNVAFREDEEGHSGLSRQE